MKPLLDKLSIDFDIVAVAIILIGGVAWLTTLNLQAAANTRDIAKIQVLEDDHTKQFEDIRDRLIRIETRVNR